MTTNITTYPSQWNTEILLDAFGQLAKKLDHPLGSLFSKFYSRLYNQSKKSSLWRMKTIVKFVNLTRTEFPVNITVNGLPLRQLYGQALDEIEILELLDSDEPKIPEKNEADQDTLLQTQAMTSDKLNFMAKRMEEQYNMITELVKSLRTGVNPR